MLYQSTRGSGDMLKSAQVIAQGLASDGGLFVPECFPQLTETIIGELALKPYHERAAFITGLFLDDYSEEELGGYTKDAYRTPVFDDPVIAPVRKYDADTHFLELWHGPTCAFKDMALQMLSRLLPAALRKTGDDRGACILVATSGDTGKAALEAFRDVPGTGIMVFYPRDGVSAIQELQMTSQEGGNVCVVAVDGNFDDTQTGVKSIFSDESIRGEADGCGSILSSANSINWGRLVPQIAYYVSAYCELLAAGETRLGNKINFCVPTGNFGNILAAYYAKKIGLPINKLICASNRNDVLTQFFGTGVYDKNRRFYTTASPSMDILVSSNLERLLFEISGKDSGAVSSYMSSLSSAGRYEVSEKTRSELSGVFAGGWCSEEDTLGTIAESLREKGYLIDTHTAVAFKVLQCYREESGDSTPAVVVSTASPYKFCEAVLRALGKPAAGDTSGVKGHGAGDDHCTGNSTCMGVTGSEDKHCAWDNSGVREYGAEVSAALTDALAAASGHPVPAPLAALRHAVPRFTGSVPPSGMPEAVRAFLRAGLQTN